GIQCDPAVNKELHPALAVGGAQTAVIGRAFIAELWRRRQRRVMRKTPRVRKDRAQRAAGRGRLQRAMKIGDEIGRCEMHAAILGLDTARWLRSEARLPTASPA